MSHLEFGNQDSLENIVSPTISTSSDTTTDITDSMIPDNSETEIQMMESYFSKKELDYINSFCEQIDIMNLLLVSQYGASAQRKIAKYSDTALESFCDTDTSAIHSTLTTLLQKLNEFSSENASFVGKNAWQAKKLLSKMRSQFNNISLQVSATVDALEEHQLILMQDISTLKEFYTRIQTCFKELSMYLLAGKKRLQYLRKTTLEDLRTKAHVAPSPQTSQAYQDFSIACERFEKKLCDLQVSQTVATQMAAQVQLLQNNDSILLENIQKILVNTIPLWKNQMLIALGMASSVAALKVQNEVTTQATGLLHNKAQSLKQSVTEMVRGSKQNEVDMETLTQTNQLLIDMITEVKHLQDSDYQKRKNAGDELKLLENELKQKLSQS